MKITKKNTVTILGSYLSPFVRKVLVTLHLKNVPYQIDPMVPFYGNSNFEKVSVLRSVPVFFDGDITLNDSSVITQYLEEKYPNPSILPVDLGERAKARFIEEYFDTYGANIIVWGLYAEIRIKPLLLNKEVDHKRIEKAKEIEIPGILEFVEKQIKESKEIFFGKVPSLAEISIGSLMRNAILSGFKVDEIKFPLTFKMLNHVYSHPSFSSLTKFEELLMKTPAPQYRKVLKEAGAPVTDDTIFLGDKPIMGKLSKF